MQVSGGETTFTVALGESAKGVCNMPLCQWVASSTNTSDSKDSFSSCNSKGNDEADDEENIETEVITMEKVISDQLDTVDQKKFHFRKFSCFKFSHV